MFAFRLAGHLGKTVAELLASLDSAELSEWMAFYETEPFGQDWRQTGIICSVVSNLVRDPKDDAFAPEDFMPKAAQPEREQTIEEQQGLAKILRDAFADRSG